MSGWQNESYDWQFWSNLNPSSPACNMGIHWGGALLILSRVLTPETLVHNVGYYQEQVQIE